MKQLLFGSTNSGKLREMAALFAPLTNIRLLAPQELQLSSPVPQVEESGSSYEENAALKARAFNAWSGLPTLADDTGVEVSALGGAPGVHSARYSGEPVDSIRNNNKLLAELATQTDRTARFVCVLHLQIDAVQCQVVRADLSGSIAPEPRGAGGFGYDSLFIPAGQSLTLAEIKERGLPFVTHRGLAVTKLLQALTTGS